MTRIEKNGVVTMLADRYQGKRLNSPNDLVYRSDGTLYFTDPPFGLPRFFEDRRNFAWGDADGRALYITARTGLYRVRLDVPGVRPWQVAEKDRAAVVSAPWY